MKKPIQIGDDVSMDDAQWEQTRRVIATSSSLAEASDLLEEDTSMIHRRRRRENSRPKREKLSAEEDMDNFNGD